MKILLAVHHFPPHRTAGAELQAYRTALDLQRRGHEVDVVCVDSIDTAPTQGVLDWRDEVVDGLRVRRLRFDLSRAPDPMRWEYDNQWIGDHLRELMHERRPDLFHLYGGYLISARPLLVAREMGIPSLVSLTEFWFICRRFTMLRSDATVSQLPIDAAVCARCFGEEKRWYRYLGRLAPKLMQAFWNNQHDLVAMFEHRRQFLLDALNQVDAIVSQSKFVGDMFLAAGIPAERVIFCRQGQEFAGSDAKALPKQRTRNLRVGYIGQVASHKGVHVLTKAVQSLRRGDVELHVYGNLSQDPQYAARLRRRIGSESQITLHGTFDHKMIAHVFSRLDVLVVPSLWYENSPNVIWEAFAHHTPVVASDLGGMAELVQHEKNGLLFPPGDSEQLAGQLNRLLEEPNLLPQLMAGMEPIRSLRQELDELVGIYESVVDGRIEPKTGHSNVDSANRRSSPSSLLTNAMS